MRSKVAKRILSQTPKEVTEFVRLYGDIVVRVHELLKLKGITQKDLADRMGKKPSEISKWLNGEHNFTLRSIAKLQAELGEPIIHVPITSGFKVVHKNSFEQKTPVPKKIDRLPTFSKVKTKEEEKLPPIQVA
ncbi:MAG: helix-turn-helix transcriptional regulator [Bacteroidia bacterium]